MEGGKQSMNIVRTPGSLYAAVYAAEFPAQALLRLRPDLRSRPVVVLEGEAPGESVCAMNMHARRRGAALRMTRVEAEELSGLCLLSRSEVNEAAASEVFLECAAQFSPRIEDACDEKTQMLVLDIAGSGRLFGPPQKIAERLRTSLQSAGFRVSIAVSANYNTARMMAVFNRGITVVENGQESSTLAKLPIAALNLPADHYETLVLWGIRTLDELAALPLVDLVSRLGQQAQTWREFASGEAKHTFRPIEAKFQLKEFMEFDTHVEQMDSLLFIGSHMIDSLVVRAASRSLSLAWLNVCMALEGGLVYERVIRPALPTTDRKFLLKLLQLEMAAHPPHAAVVTLSLSAEAGQASTVQLGLFSPQMPEPSRLDVTLARLKALVGDDRVGSPVLEDTHEPGCFRMGGFIAGTISTQAPPASPCMSLRRMRPPSPVRVTFHSMRPATFRDRANRYEITAAYGPWKTSGCWWSTNRWDTEEWDVLAQNAKGETMACLLVLDRLHNCWQLEALYD
jgi:protein ImuB